MTGAIAIVLTALDVTIRLGEGNARNEFSSAVCENKAHSLLKSLLASLSSPLRCLRLRPGLGHGLSPRRHRAYAQNARVGSKLRYIPPPISPPHLPPIHTHSTRHSPHTRARACFPTTTKSSTDAQHACLTLIHERREERLLSGRRSVSGVVFFAETECKQHRQLMYPPSRTLVQTDQGQAGFESSAFDVISKVLMTEAELDKLKTLQRTLAKCGGMALLTCPSLLSPQSPQRTPAGRHAHVTVHRLLRSCWARGVVGSTVWLGLRLSLRLRLRLGLKKVSPVRRAPS